LEHHLSNPSPAVPGQTPAELVAVHTERYGATEPSAAGDAADLAIGSRPQPFAAALSWDRAAEATRAAATVVDAGPKVPPEQFLVDPQPEVLSVLD